MEQLELELQQLVDILVQLGFTKLESIWDEDYFSNELNVYWSNDVNRVFNIIGAYSKDSDICIRGIDGKSLATNIAYFQKQLDEKINQDSQHEDN